MIVDECAMMAAGRPLKEAPSSNHCGNFEASAEVQTHVRRDALRDDRDRARSEEASARW
jgi:hypothetical protein